jgi:hypothetical protein
MLSLLQIREMDRHEDEEEEEGEDRISASIAALSRNLSRGRW